MIAFISAASGIIIGAIGTLGTVYQVRARRWEMKGEVERSDAATLWNTVLEIVNKLTATVFQLLEAVQKLSAEQAELTNTMKDLARKIEQLVDEQRRMRTTVEKLNGG
jgi:cell division protein FtsB